MKRIQDVIGLPILDVSSGKKVGTVEDIYFNNSEELIGVAVEAHNLFTKKYYLSFADIDAIGDDAVTVSSKNLFSSSFPQEQYYGFKTGNKIYKELPVITTNGQELGYIKDVYFMEKMGKIIGYEISDGFLSDITEGRRTINVPKKMVIGEDAMVVPVDEVNDVIFDGNI